MMVFDVRYGRHGNPLIPMPAAGRKLPGVISTTSNMLSRAVTGPGRRNRQRIGHQPPTKERRKQHSTALGVRKHPGRRPSTSRNVRRSSYCARYLLSCWKQPWMCHPRPSQGHPRPTDWILPRAFPAFPSLPPPPFPDIKQTRFGRRRCEQ